jgi:hypothetical protein
MTADDASPAVRSMDPHDQFDALVGWLHSDEAMGLPFAEVERRLGNELAALLERLVGEH